ncbi:MAG: hypothetical protein IIC93_05425 [Chloroflexi bacterium]|nr:hypothetical protein [Chloroflexota bacterium]
MGRPGRRATYNTAAMNLGTVGIAPFFLVVAAPFASDRISATRTSCGAYAIVGNLVLLCEVQIDDCSGLFDPVKYPQAEKPCLTRRRRVREDRILVQKAGAGDIGTDHL